MEKSRGEIWGLKERGQGTYMEEGELAMVFGQGLRKEPARRGGGKRPILLSWGKPHCVPALTLH